MRQNTEEQWFQPEPQSLFEEINFCVKFLEWDSSMDIHSEAMCSLSFVGAVRHRQQCAKYEILGTEFSG